MRTSQQNQQTGKKTSVPARGKRPGFKRGRRGLPYWMVSQLTKVKTAFPDKCIALPPDADDATLDRLCQEHTARFQAWLSALPTVTALPSQIRYDGTVFSACQIFRYHRHSQFNKVKKNTRKDYADSLKIIEATVGARLIRNLTVFDCDGWYDEWKKPAEIVIEEDGTEIIGPEQIRRAHGAISVFKMVIKFVGIALRRDECKRLAGELEHRRYDRSGAREQELTYEQVSAFIAAADDLAAREVIPAERALYMAIAVATAFDIGLRPKDVIGQWFASQVEALEQAKKARIQPLRFGDEWWLGFYTWERIPGWRWRMRTSKSKYKSHQDVTLSHYGLLFPLLERVPLEERTGSIVKGEQGLPMRARSAQKWFRQIARAADIPDDVLWMDARAGAATESLDALEKTIPLTALPTVQKVLGHSRPEMTERYVRRRSAEAVASARAEFRKADGEAS